MPDCPRCAAAVPPDAAYCPRCGSRLAAEAGVEEPEDSADQDLERLRDELAAALAPRREIVRLLGCGGMGAVFLAREPALRRFVAVKVLAPRLAADPTARERFTREARAAAAISHPHVLRVFDVGVTDESDLPYIVMQYVDGQPLSDWTRGDAARVTEREARRVIGQVAQALEAAHRCGLVHRDIKPGNVLLESDTGHAYVCDFGLTAAIAGAHSEDDTRLTRSGTLMGTPVYMSPEQAASRPVGPASDIYSLGVLAYEMLTGELPLSSSTPLGWASAHLRDVPDSVSDRRSDLSAEVIGLVDRCLAKRPEDRPTAGELASGLFPTLESEIEWPPPGLGALHRRWKPLAKILALTAGAGVLLSLALAFPPEAVRIEGNWWERYEGVRQIGGSALGVRSEIPEVTGPGAPWPWGIALAGSIGAFAVGLLAFCIISFRLALACVRARGSGWRWRTIVDAFTDHDGRTGLLLSGSREFASLPRACRREARRARRATAGGLLCAGLWVTATLGVWAILVTANAVALRGAGPVLGAAMLLIIALPALFCAGAGLAGIRRETRFLRPLDRRRPHAAVVSGDTAPGPETAAAWYDALADPDATGPTRPRSGRLKAALAAAWLGSAGSSALALVALTVIAGAAWVAGNAVQRHGPATGQAVNALDRAAVQDPIASAGRALRAYQPPSEADEALSVRPLARELLADPSDPASAPPYSSEQRSLLARYGGARIAAALATIPESYSVGELRLLESLAHHPRTLLFRRLARAPSIDLLAAGLDRPLSDYGSWADVPDLPYPRLGQPGRANALAAAVAYSRGEIDSAYVRLGENSRVAEHLLATPALFASRYGIVMLVELAMAPLAVLEELGGNEAAAEYLQDSEMLLRTQLLTVSWSSGLAGLAADPGDGSRLLEVSGNESLPAGLRIATLDAAWAGYCANPREILTGLSPAREAMLAAAARSMSDVSHADQIASLVARMWQARFGGWLWPMTRAGGDGAGVVASLRKRLAWCARGG